MLSGKVPFQSTSHVDLAAAIMQKIKGGQFDLSGPEWKDVSDNAKKLIKGMHIGIIKVLGFRRTGPLFTFASHKRRLSEK